MKNISYFLGSLYQILVLVRFKISEQYSFIILKTIQKLLNNTLDYELLKNNILKIEELDEYSRDYLNNVLNTIEKNKNINNKNEIDKYIPILRESINTVIYFLEKGQIERAYDLIDAIHCLPIMLLEKKRWRPSGFWKNYINPYREKWDKDFLCNEEKKIRRKVFFRNM